jgi:hypothetical protein
MASDSPCSVPEAPGKGESMLSFHSGLVALVIALVYACSPNVVAEQEKQAVTLVAICEDAAAKEMIRESLLTHFRPLQDLEVVNKNGVQFATRLCRENG